MRRPRGQKTDSIAYLRFTNPTFRLNAELEEAAMKAHPGWRQIKDSDPADWVREPIGEEGDWTAEPGTPCGTKLIKWFYKAHPCKAERIERDFTKRLWAGKL